MKKKANPIHINKTGRIVFNQAAQKQLGDTKSMRAEVDGRVIRLKPSCALCVSRPKPRVCYIPEGQARPILKPLGFVGSRSRNPKVKFCSDGGFEFKFQP